MKNLTSTAFSCLVNSIAGDRAEPISVQVMGHTIFIFPNAITFLEGEGNYSFIHTSCGKRYMVSKTLKSLSTYLDQNFLRIHKSYLVNKDFIVERIDDNRFLKMACGNEVSVSRRKIKEIASILDGLKYRISA